MKLFKSKLETLKIIMKLNKAITPRTLMHPCQIMKKKRRRVKSCFRLKMNKTCLKNMAVSMNILQRNYLKPNN